MEISTIEIILIISLLLSIAFSIFLFLKIRKLSKHYNALTKDVEGKQLYEILTKHLKRIEKNITHTKNLEKNIDNLKKESKLYLQKIGFKRFNPFLETGGNQSFILAMLDLNNNGYILTSLHQRETTRIYAKLIKKGKAENKLSEEEMSVLKEIL